MLENERFADETGISSELYLYESALSDPFVTSALELAKEYNHILIDEPALKEDISLMIAELDKKWGSLQGATVKLTGFVTAPTPDGVGIERYFVDSTQVVSRGFDQVSGVKYIDGDEVETAPRIVLSSIISASNLWGNEDLNGINPEAPVVVHAEVDSCHIEVNGVSPERAQAWLTLSSPELIDEIDSRVFNSSDYEEGALMSLKGINFNEFPYITDEFTRTCVDVHLESILDFDKNAPYDISFNGKGKRQGESGFGEYKDFKTDGALAMVEAVNLQLNFENDNKDSAKWELGVYAGIISNRREDPIQYFWISIDAVENLSSIRRTFYES